MAIFSLLLLPFLLLHAFLILPSSGGRLIIGSIQQPFRTSNIYSVDNNGAFLTSPNSSFRAVMHNPSKQQSRYYFCVVHSSTHTIVWSANASSAVSSTGLLTLSASGLSLTVNDTSTAAVWLTPRLPSSVTSLHLLDTGNLVLTDKSNRSLWQSFDHPSDTFVSGQRIPVGGFLTSSTSDTDLSRGDYRMVVTSGDVVLQWSGGQQYWALSTHVRSFRNSNRAVSYMEMNDTGLFLLSGMGRNTTVVDFVPLPPPSEFRIGKVDAKGHFLITSYATVMVNSSSPPVNELMAPESSCDLPFTCKTLGLCRSGSIPCSCPAQFAHSDDGCVPSDGYVLASSTSCDPSPVVKFLSLGSKVGYFAYKFAKPTLSKVNLNGCQSSCSGNCSCLGFYYKNSSRSCYFLQHQLGTVVSRDDSGDVTYIKTIPGETRPKDSFPGRRNLLPILLPFIALVLLLVVLLLFFGRWRLQKRQSSKKSRLSPKEIHLGKKSWPREEDSTEDDEDESISIPGLPARFSYQELDDATEGFNTRIGSGGFGEVFKGSLPDKTDVAVKRIGNLGIQGKKEFCTEIAVIGKIHHVNLVKLRGFCAQGSRRLLVYEFMNRGSLDRSLFGTTGRPVLEWQERVDIAVGSARGLAYLHGGCENRIIHCDIKPENILLHDHNSVKISDFGLAKLLTPEQSSLFTTLRGTRGYLAPEWLTNSAISDRTDVYSFGMVLLEIVRGRKNCVSSIPGAAMASSAWSEGLSTSPARMVAAATAAVKETYFPLVALEKHEEGNYEELADPKLQGRVTAEEVAKMVKIALCCLHEEPGRRPSIAAVAGMLEGTLPVWEPRLESLNFLRFYGREVVLPAGAVTAGGSRVGFGRAGNSAVVTSSTTFSSAVSLSHLASEQLSGPR